MPGLAQIASQSRPVMCDTFTVDDIGTVAPEKSLKKQVPCFSFFGDFNLRDESKLYINQWLCTKACFYPSWCDLLLAAVLPASSYLNSSGCTVARA